MAEIVKLAEPATFEAFWSLYPRKVAKPLARAKWNAITNGGLKTKTLDRDSGCYIDIELSATPDEIVGGLRAWKRTLPLKQDFSLAVEERFIPHPATWLNQGRWMDHE